MEAGSGGVALRPAGRMGASVLVDAFGRNVYCLVAPGYREPDSIMQAVPAKSVHFPPLHGPQRLYFHLRSALGRAADAMVHPSHAGEGRLTPPMQRPCACSI